MIKGPLVYSTVVIAAVLIVLSFAAAFAPEEYLVPICAVGGIVALCAVVVLIVMLIRTRKV